MAYQTSIPTLIKLTKRIMKTMVMVINIIIIIIKRRVHIQERGGIEKVEKKKLEKK